MKKHDWKTIKEKIYHKDGSLRDVYILNTDKDDWKKWIDFVNSNYALRWYNSITDKTTTKIDFESVKSHWYERENGSTAKIYTGDLQINVHFFCESEIENDIDPREFISIEQHRQLVNYLKSISKVCEKPVILTHENSPNDVLIRVMKNEVELIFSNGSI